MHAYGSLVVAMVAFRGSLASLTPAPAPTTTFLGTLPGNNKTPRAETTLGTLPGDNKPCITPVATITQPAVQLGICVPVCVKPTSSCSAGEPTGPTPNPPHSTTVAPSGACTATVEVFNNPGCGNCPTCTTAPALEARQTVFPGHKVCSPRNTVVTTIGPQTTTFCACPLALTQCSSGEPTVSPLPTTTLIEGCVESIVVGPGDCSNVCPQCA